MYPKLLRRGGVLMLRFSYFHTFDRTFRLFRRLCDVLYSDRLLSGIGQHDDLMSMVTPDVEMFGWGV